MADRVLAALHDCPGSPAGWIEVLSAISAAFGSTLTGFFWRRHGHNHVPLAIHHDPTTLDEYNAHYASVNPWVIRGPKFTQDKEGSCRLS